MWICERCGQRVDDWLSDCRHCGTRRADSAQEFNAGEPEPATVIDGWPGPEPSLVSQVLQPEIEPRRASTLAVWVWCLAVFAFFPVLGVPVALALAVCSLILMLRDEHLPWDRRIGRNGLAISVAALLVPSVWLTMLLLRYPFDIPQFGELPAAPQRTWQVTVIQIVVLVVSIMLHECAHAVAAYWSGDATAARLGRISLNPLVHVDPFGSIILPAILAMTPGNMMFGWAKPVPIQVRQFRNHRRGLLAVTLAGVSVNLMLALACASGLLVVGSVLRLAHPEAVSQGFSLVFLEAEIHGVPGAVGWQLVIMALKSGLLVNLVLFNFNVLPIPPLDGYGVLESLAPASLLPLVHSLRGLGWIVLLVFIATDLVSYLLLPGLALGLLLNILVSVMTGWA